MEIAYLYEFVELARHMSISKTARLLYLSQPTISQHITQLEDELGYKLFERGGQRLELTPEGVGFLMHAQDIIRIHKDMRDPVSHAVVASVRVVDIFDFFPVGRRITRAARALTGEGDGRSFSAITRIPYGTAYAEELVDKGMCDISFSFAAPGDDVELGRLRASGYKACVVMREGLLATFRSDSRLAGCGELETRDLDGCTSLVCKLPFFESYRTALIAIAGRAGITLRERLSYASPTDFPLYPSDLDVSIVTAQLLKSFALSWGMDEGSVGYGVLPADPFSVDLIAFCKGDGSAHNAAAFLDLMADASLQ